MDKELFQAAATIAAAFIQKDENITAPTPQVKDLVIQIYRILEPAKKDLTPPQAGVVMKKGT